MVLVGLGSAFISSFQLTPVAQRSGLVAGEPPDEAAYQQDEQRLDGRAETHIPVEHNILGDGERYRDIDHDKLLFTAPPRHDQAKEREQEDGDGYILDHKPYDLRREPVREHSEWQAVFRGERCPHCQ